MEKILAIWCQSSSQVRLVEPWSCWGSALTLEPEHSPSGWAPAPGACLGVWAECSHPYMLCVPRAPSPKASPAQAPPPYSSSERLSRIKQSTSWNAELQYFLKRCNFIYCPWSEEEFNSNQPIWPLCPQCPWYLRFHTQKPTSPTPQAPTEDPTTLSRFKCIKWLLFSPISCEYYTAFSARNLHSEFSGSGQIISDSCSEMQDLVTCSTIKLPWASSSPFLIFVQTPPLLHRQQPIFRVLPLHRERATGISNICSNKDSSLISTVSAYFKHQRFQQTNTSISFF